MSKVIVRLSVETRGDFLRKVESDPAPKVKNSERNTKSIPGKESKEKNMEHEQRKEHGNFQEKNISFCSS